MAADHYLNKVFVYIPPREDNNSPPTVSWNPLQSDLIQIYFTRF